MAPLRHLRARDVVAVEVSRVKDQDPGGIRPGGKSRLSKVVRVEVPRRPTWLRGLRTAAGEG